MPLIVNELMDKNPDLSVTLTDLFPHKEWINPLQKSKQNQKLKYHPQAINAKNVPPDMVGCRTLLSPSIISLLMKQHTFLEMLYNPNSPSLSLNSQRPSLFFMPLRHIPSIWFPSTYGCTFFIHLLVGKSYSLTIVPIIPFIIVLDGIVSVLRTYSTEELRDVATKAGCEGYRWEIRQSKDLGNGLMTCLIGWPDDNDGVHIIEYE